MSMGQFQAIKSAHYLKNGRTEEGDDPDEMTLDKLDELKSKIKARKDGARFR